MVHCGIDARQFPEASPLPEGPTRLIAIGRFAPQKGFPLLLPALAAARSKADIHLTLVGDGPLRGALEAQAEELNLGAAVRLEPFTMTGPPKSTSAIGRVGAGGSIMDGLWTIDGLVMRESARVEKLRA